MANNEPTVPEESKIEFQAKLRQAMEKRGWNPAERLMNIYDRLCEGGIRVGKGEKERYADHAETLDLQVKIAVNLEKLAQKEEELNIKKVETMKGKLPKGNTVFFTPGMKEEQLPDGRVIFVPMQAIPIQDKTHEK